MINLEKRVLEVETEYLTLLQSIEKTYTDQNVFSVLDSIRLFWFKNRKLVSLFLQTLKAKEAFSYSGATHLDVNDKEYYGFLAVGKIHIMDDQLYKYADILLQGRDFPGVELIKKQIKITLEDNIKVLQDLNGIVLLLPVRLFYENLEIIHKTAETCFLNFFNNKYSSIHSYLEKCRTIEDIKENINGEIFKSIFIWDNDDINISFTERLKLIPDSLYHTENIAVNFFLSIQGFLISALEMLETMHDYGIIPIVRNKATLSYLYLLEPNLNKDFDYLNKIVLANEIFAVINQNIEDYEQFTPNEINECFIKAAFFYKLFNDLELSKRSINDITFVNRINLIKEKIKRALL